MILSRRRQGRTKGNPKIVLPSDMNQTNTKKADTHLCSALSGAYEFHLHCL